jgi:hypothetical protein
MEVKFADVDLSGIDDSKTCGVCAKLVELFKMLYRQRLLTACKYKNQISIFLEISYLNRKARTGSINQPFELVARDHQQNHPGRSRILDPEWVDMDVVCAWYSVCVKEHGMSVTSPNGLKM